MTGPQKRPRNVAQRLSSDWPTPRRAHASLHACAWVACTNARPVYTAHTPHVHPNPLQERKHAQPAHTPCVRAGPRHTAAALGVSPGHIHGAQSRRR